MGSTAGGCFQTMWTRNCGKEQGSFYAFSACKWMCQMLFKLLGVISKSTASMLPVAKQIYAWRADLLNTLLSTTRPAHSTPQKPSVGVDGELSPQRPVGSLILLSQRPGFLTFFNRLWIAIHSTASGRERTVEGGLQSSSLPCSHAWLSSLPNKGLSSFSFQSGGVSKGCIGLGWGWTGNLQKIENKNDLCKFSSGKPAFLVACIYNIKGEITNKAVNEWVWIRSLFFGSPCLESSVQPSHWLAASIW